MHAKQNNNCIWAMFIWCRTMGKRTNHHKNSEISYWSFEKKKKIIALIYIRNKKDDHVLFNLKSYHFSHLFYELMVWSWFAQFAKYCWRLCVKEPWRKLGAIIRCVIIQVGNRIALQITDNLGKKTLLYSSTQSVFQLFHLIPRQTQHCLEANGNIQFDFLSNDPSSFICWICYLWVMVYAFLCAVRKIKCFTHIQRWRKKKWRRRHSKEKQTKSDKRDNKSHIFHIEA